MRKSLDYYFDQKLADITLGQKIIYWLALHLGGGTLRILYRVKFINTEIVKNMPKGEACIVAGNHSSYVDPCLVIRGLHPTRIRFIGKESLFSHKVVGRFLAYIGIYPVYKKQGDRSVIKRSVRNLRNGENIGIFPEGTRVKERDKEKVESYGGVALIAKMADVKIVPVGIQGAIDISPDGSKRMHFPKITLRFGEPVYWRDYEHLGKRDIFEAVTDEVMRRAWALEAGEEPEILPPPTVEEYEALKAQRAAERAAQEQPGEQAGDSGEGAL